MNRGLPSRILYQFGRSLFTLQRKTPCFPSTSKTRGRYFLYVGSLTSSALVGYLLRKDTALVCHAEGYRAEENDIESDLAEADRLHSEHKTTELHNYLFQFKDSTNHELLWRVARAHSDRSHMSDVSGEEKKKLIFDAMDVISRALKLGPNNCECHKWYGIMLCETGDYLGIKTKLNKAYVLKEHFEKAVELCPNDAISHHLNGMWCFTFADLSWYERKLATLVFGAPPTSTYEEALEYFQRGEEIDPWFFSSNQYMLGLVCKRLGRLEEAKKWFKMLLDFPVVKEIDKENIRKAEGELRSM